VLWAVCRFYCVLTVGKRKRKFVDKLNSKNSCFQIGHDKWEAKCLVCRPATYVSVANKDALDF
jgi:hypothetical protein